MKFKKGVWWKLGAVVAAVILLVAGCGIYVSDYYKADTEAISKWKSCTVRRESLGDTATVYRRHSIEKSDAAFIFYPGGKVEHTAYEPLMKHLAGSGVVCILVEMPFRLAVLDMNAADEIRQQFPTIEHWYIGGHSLGGSMAASHAATHREDYEGLVLLGAYSTADLSESGLEVLSLYGSEDTVMNKEKYKKNLPYEYTEYIIKGGCHAYFGEYGAQKGDGVPTISHREQIVFTGEKIKEMIQH